MGYRTLRQCVEDLERTGQLVRVAHPVDAHLEIAEIQRRLYRARGPAVLLENVRGCRFPMLANLFGTIERVRYLFRDALEGLAQVVALQAEPQELLRRPRLLLRVPRTAWHARPKRVKRAAVLAHETAIAELPQLKSWPGDGGAYVTLPQVYTEDPDEPGFTRANLGMYRVQLSGGQYEPGREVGMHYQLHRGIAAHHAKALARGQPLKVNVFVGGPPAMTVAAVMPLPEGVSELSFAGMLGRRRVPMVCPRGGLPVHAEADFCISGYLDPQKTLPEGPFGDHLGYYSLEHEFPVMRVERVTHRDGAIWPFTVVGRPPQEDTVFGELIHELVGPVLPRAVPGLKAVHAVDAAGVHPLLLALGSERYAPYEPRRRPMELLTLANAVLGQGQMSLAKYLWIAAAEDAPGLDVRDVGEFLRHVLERADWRRDLHFQTCSTIDTLDYSGPGIHQGSKLVVAAAGPPLRRLPVACDSRLRLPEELGFRNPRVCLPGVLAVEGPPFSANTHVGRTSSPSPVGRSATPSHTSNPVGRSATPSHTNSTTLARNGRDTAVDRFCSSYKRNDPINGFPLVVVVDRSDFVARSLENFLWTTFTRSNPAADVYGVEPFFLEKHWGCFGSLVIDARAKPHHAPPLVEDPDITRRVDQLARPGGPLHGVI